LLAENQAFGVAKKLKILRGETRFFGLRERKNRGCDDAEKWRSIETGQCGSARTKVVNVVSKVDEVGEDDLA